MGIYIFVYPHRGWKLIYNQVSYPLRSLLSYFFFSERDIYSSIWSRTRKFINLQKKLSNPEHSDSQLSPTRLVNDSHESNDSLINNITTAVPEASKIQHETSKIKVAEIAKIKTDVYEASNNVKVKTELPDEYTAEKKKQDELVIKDLLDNIKESFESQFDMDLEQFSEPETQFFGQVSFDVSTYSECF